MYVNIHGTSIEHGEINLSLWKVTDYAPAQQNHIPLYDHNTLQQKNWILFGLHLRNSQLSGSHFLSFKLSESFVAFMLVSL